MNESSTLPPASEEVNTAITEQPLQDETFNFSSSSFQFAPITEPLDKRHYNRVGFICAITHHEQPENELKAIIDQHKSLIKEMLEQLQTIYTLKSADLTRQTDELYQLITSEEIKLLSLNEDVEQFKKKKEELLLHLQQLENDLSAVYREFGERKEKMIENRIEEVKKELTKIIENYKAIYDQRTDINKHEYESNKNAIEKRIRLLETFIERNKKAYESLSAKLLPLTEMGISENAVAIMISFAFSAAIGAGWFFSIYALNEKFDNKDGIGFILEGIFQFGNTLVTNVGNPFAAGIILTISLLLFIGITGVIAWIAQKIIDRYNSSSTNIKVDFETDEYLRFLLRTKITATNFISFWMQLSPYVFIGGVIYIILVMGNAGKQISDVSTSLSAQTVGTFFALLTSGVSLIYVMKVIEPRLQTQGNTRNVWLRSNIELAGILSLFIVFIILLSTGISSKTSVVPIMGFAVMTLLTGILMGYALRYKALLTQVKDLEFQTERFAIEVQKLSRPKPLFIEYTEGKLFNTKFVELEQELMDLSILKSKQATYLWQGQAVKRVNRKGYWDRFWSNLTSDDKNIQGYDEASYYNLTATEERFFPSISTRIEEYRKKIAETKAELIDLTGQINNIKNGTSFLSTLLKNNIDDARKKVNELQANLIECRVNFKQQCESLHLLREFQEMNLRDGFDVGIWYRVHQLDSMTSFHKNATIQTTNSHE